MAFLLPFALEGGVLLAGELGLDLGIEAAVESVVGEETVQTLGAFLPHARRAARLASFAGDVVNPSFTNGVKRRRTNAAGAYQEMRRPGNQDKHYAQNKTPHPHAEKSNKTGFSGVLSRIGTAAGNLKDRLVRRYVQISDYIKENPDSLLIKGIKATLKAGLEYAGFDTDLLSKDLYEKWIPGAQTAFAAAETVQHAASQIRKKGLPPADEIARDYFGNTVATAQTKKDVFLQNVMDLGRGRSAELLAELSERPQDVSSILARHASKLRYEGKNLIYESAQDAQRDLMTSLLRDGTAFTHNIDFLPMSQFPYPGHYAGTPKDNPNVPRTTSGEVLDPIMLGMGTAPPNSTITEGHVGLSSFGSNQIGASNPEYTGHSDARLLNM